MNCDGATLDTVIEKPLLVSTSLLSMFYWVGWVMSIQFLTLFWLMQIKLVRWVMKDRKRTGRDLLPLQVWLAGCKHWSRDPCKTEAERKEQNNKWIKIKVNE